MARNARWARLAVRASCASEAGRAGTATCVVSVAVGDGVGGRWEPANLNYGRKPSWPTEQARARDAEPRTTKWDGEFI